MSATFEFVPQLPIPAAIGTVPLRRMTWPLSREDVVSILDRAEPLVSYPLWKV